MMRAHCDRCDALCDEYPSWVEDSQPQAKTSSSGSNTIWHIHIGDSDVTMFCRACRIAILEAHIKILKTQKAPRGGHFADCRWDADALRYVCVDGCEIKRINES